MRNISIQAPSNQYIVQIGRGDDLEPITHNGKVLIVSNPKIAGLYLPALMSKIKAKEVFVCTVPDGEEHKNMRSIEQILQSAFNHRLDRKSLFIAFGGGVIGDMVGFASGIYQRGVEFIQIPTTLLAQVDSSVGGKTGVNNDFGKNLVGVFHQPKAVFINTDFLQTLPSREFSAGLAEIIKMAVCFDKDFFAFLQEQLLQHSLQDFCLDYENLEYVIAKSIEIKAKVVEQDEKERGIRAALNYGHTFGHAIENLTHYTTYLHGECVAIGICMANALARNLGLLSPNEEKSIKSLLQSCNLPTHFDIADKEVFYERLFLDKKSLDSAITFVLPNHIGGVCMRNDIDKQAVLEIL